jgi:hypothetical protein
MKIDKILWKDLYHGAICESNVNKLPGRIDDAEAALVIRARELYHAVDDELEEKFGRYDVHPSCPADVTETPPTSCSEQASFGLPKKCMTRLLTQTGI